MTRLTHLSLGNFKAFDERVTARLAPLTLIYGANSSGKTSLVQGLLLLMQSQLRAEAGPQLVSHGPLADMGNFRSLVHAHDLRRTMSLEFAGDFQRVGPARLTASLKWSARVRSATLHRTEVEIDGRTIAFTLRTRLTASGVPQASYFVLASPVDVEEWARTIEVGVPGRLLADASWDSFVQALHSGAIRPQFAARGFMPGVVQGLLTVGDTGALRYDAAALTATEAWNELASAFHAGTMEMIDTLAYLGPLRSPPQRFVISTDDTRSGVGVSGSLATEVLATDTELLIRVNEWFERLGIPYNVSVEQIGSPGTEATSGVLLAMVLTDVRSGLRVAGNDVGFGISQLLPVVVQCLLSRDSLIVIEQPEIHVHPGLQASLADLLITSALDHNNQLIVETHSEHLMLRVQRRMRSSMPGVKRPRPSDISVLYVERLANGTSEVLDLGIDEHGNFLDEWPGGFFEERFHELFGPDR